MNEFKEITLNKRKEKWILMITSFLLGLMIIGQAYYIVVVVEGVFLDNLPFNAVISSLIGLAIVLFGRVIFTYWNRRVGIQMASEVKKEIREQILSKYKRNPLKSSLEGQSGHKVSLIMDSVDELDPYFSKYYPLVIQASIVPVMIIIAMFYVNWLSAVTLLVTAPFIPLFFIIIGIQTQKKSDEQVGKLAAFSAAFLDTLQGLQTIKYFGRGKERAEVIRNNSIGYRDATMSVLKTAFLNTLMIEFIAMLSFAIIALEVGYRLVVYQNISFFAAFFILILAPEFFTFLKELSGAFHTGRGSIGAMKLIKEELAEDKETEKWSNSSKKSLLSPPSVSLKNIHFQYGESGFKLNIPSAEIKPFEKIALVGKTGSGKTTLLSLFGGLYQPNEGEVLINGEPIHTFSEKNWFKELSYVSQNPYLFSGSLLENISMNLTDEEVPLEDITAAAIEAGLLDLMNELPNGLHTEIGEGGRGLSGGEKQRVALARAFLRKPKIILFDEPTAGLDVFTERILKSAIELLSQKATVFIVAHRLHTIRDADQIFFMDDGKLIAAAPHEHLISENEQYRQMIQVQQGGEENE